MLLLNFLLLLFCVFSIIIFNGFPERLEEIIYAFGLRVGDLTMLL